MNKTERRIAAKKRKADGARGIAPQRSSETRLPPGQHLVERFPVLDLGVSPAIETAQWRLTLHGLVEQPLDLNWQAFHQLPQEEFVSDIHCVTSWSRFDNHWRGVAVRHLLEAARPLSEARFVFIRSFDNYTTNMPLDDFAHEQCLLATHWEGKPLTREHGAPVRLIIPHLYLWKSAKWIKEIILADTNERGFWEQNGYHNDANPWDEQRYAWQE